MLSYTYISNHKIRMKTSLTAKINIPDGNINEHSLDKSFQSKEKREKGQWVVYYTSPQSYIITFSYLLA